ncbi:MAG: hypothetical protein WDW36_002366 [Sanguina aurantia]
MRLRRRASLWWEEGKPKRVLLVKKPSNKEASQTLGEIGRWLQARGLEVYVERAVQTTEFREFKSWLPKTRCSIEAAAAAVAAKAAAAGAVNFEEAVLLGSRGHSGSSTGSSSSALYSFDSIESSLFPPAVPTSGGTSSVSNGSSSSSSSTGNGGSSGHDTARGHSSTGSAPSDGSTSHESSPDAGVANGPATSPMLPSHTIISGRGGGSDALCSVSDTAEPLIDLCITLGGDGTVLHTASLFDCDTPLPPFVCFAMGSLGFLTPFDATHYQRCLARVLDTGPTSAPLNCTLRTRKRCEEFGVDGNSMSVHHVLNECVLDRGAFPGAMLLELYIDGQFVTSTEADGLIISTPSGSTAYSMSAGGPMVAPSVPCSIITPMAPLTLSFRPIVVPENSIIAIHVPERARAPGGRASFDGKKPIRLKRGSTMVFTTSHHPLPVINLGNLDSDWYDGITSKLKWAQQLRDPGPRRLPDGAARHAAEGGPVAGSRVADT